MHYRQWRICMALAGVGEKFNVLGGWGIGAQSF